jgi:thiol-disulfide isomerase/thioredoxin
MNKLLRVSIVTTLCYLIILKALPTFGQSCQVNGYIKGLGNKPVVFGYEHNGSYRLDTVFATKDRFTYLAKPSDSGQIDLRIIRERYTSFWYEPGLVKVVGAIEKPDQLTITGTPDNNISDLYNQTISWPFEAKRQGKYDSLRQEEQQQTLQFIRQHPNAQTSAYLLYWQTIYDAERIDTYDELFEGLTTLVKASYQGKQVAKRLNVLHNQPVVGKKAPNFTIPDTAGVVHSLSSYQGKYVLLDFWGHWCGPCLKSFPKLKQLQQDYKESLTVIGVAAEYASDKAIWEKTIATHNLNWVHLSELKSDKGEVTEAYNITAYPTYFLLDKEGVVLAKTNGLETIEQKLKAIDK